MHVEPSAPWTHPMPGLSVCRRTTTPIRAFQVYGQRCSGTNAIIRSIEANFGKDSFTEAYGFKHWFVPRQTLFPRDVMVLVIAREPVEWLRSLHKQPWHAHETLKAMPFDAFIRAEWHSYWDDQFWGIDADHPTRGKEMMQERCPETGARFPNVLAKRTAKLRQWSDLTNRAHNVALLDYGRFRDDPAGVIAALSDATGMTAADPFVALDSYKGQGFFPYVRNRYDDVSGEDAAHIAQWLDPVVEGRFGFALPAVAATAG